MSNNTDIPQSTINAFMRCPLPSPTASVDQLNQFVGRANVPSLRIVPATPLYALPSNTVNTNVIEQVVSESISTSNLTDYQGQWGATQQYAAGSQVSYCGNAWQAISANLGSTPAIGNANWLLLGPVSLSSVADDANYAKVSASNVISGVPYTFAGTWNSTSTFLPGQEVTNGGNYWLCLAQNSNSEPTSTNPHWQLIGPSSASSLTGSQVFVGAWGNTVNYDPGNEVSHAGNLWLCLIANSGSEPTTTNTKWQLMGPTSASDLSGSQVFMGAWSASITYEPGNEVTDGGNYFICVLANTNSEPTATNANWQLVGPASASSLTGSQVFVGPWSSGVNYDPGNEVTDEGNYWICLVANVNSEPAASNPHWQLVGPASAGSLPGSHVFLGPWAPTIDYAPGSEVSDNSNVWLCLLDTAAGGNPEPGKPTYDGNLYWQLMGPLPSTAVAPWISTEAYNVSDEVTYAANPTGTGSITASPAIVNQVHRQNDWVNPANAEGTSAWATATLYASNQNVNKSSFLQLTGFNFNSIPAGATVTGITVTYTPKHIDGSSGVYTDSLTLLGLTGTPNDHSPSYPNSPWSSPVTLSSGGQTDTWGVVPLLAQVQASTFGVQVGCECTVGGSGGHVAINGVTITVYYATSGLGTTNFYKCLVANVGENPATSPAYWQLAGPNSVDAVADGNLYAKTMAKHVVAGVPYTLMGAWVAGTAYLVGQEVTYNGNYYTCTTANSDATFNSAHWTLVGPTSLTSVADDANYAKVVTSALTSNQIDLAKSGVVNKTLDNISSVAGFSPSSISGMLAWYDASSLTGYANGANVASFPDKSGNGYTMTGNGVYTLPSQNGLATIQFAGYPDAYVAPIPPPASQPFTLFLAGLQSGGGACYLINDNATGAELIFGYVSGTYGILGSPTPLYDPGVNTTAFNVLAGIANGASSLLSFNGTAVTGNAGTSVWTSTGLHIGANNNAGFALGYFGEAIIYAGALTTAQRQEVEGYLAWKWLGSGSNLPPSHPYYSVNPSLGFNSVSQVDNNRRSIIDLSQPAHLGKHLGNIPDDLGSSRYAVLAVDTNRRPYVDLGQAGHLGKNIDNISDGSTYARLLGTGLTSGGVNFGAAAHSGVLPRINTHSSITGAIDSSGHVQNLGGTAASSITPIAAKMPAEAGAQVFTGKDISLLGDGVYVRPLGSALASAYNNVNGNLKLKNVVSALISSGSWVAQPGSALALSVSAGGTGFVSGDVGATLTSTTGTTKFTATIASVSGGAVTGVTLTSPGYGPYTANTAYSVTGGTGSGCQLKVTLVQGNYGAPLPNTVTATTCGNQVLILFTVSFSAAASTTPSIYLWRDGTSINAWPIAITVNSAYTFFFVDTPSTGSHIYEVAAGWAAGTYSTCKSGVGGIIQLIELG